MLYTFTSKVQADVVMFGNIAGELLRAMGQKEEKPGILRGDDIKVAADRLRAYLDAAPHDESNAGEDDKNKTEEERIELRNRVGLRIRALPLLELLEESYAREVDVIWR